MSGGEFDYKQHVLLDIADRIEREIERNGRDKTDDEMDSWDKRNGYTQWYKYPDEVIDKFKIAIKLLNEARVYAHRIDWLLSGDDGEETFLERLNEDLEKLKSKNE
jgi:hypothetical protein